MRSAGPVDELGDEIILTVLLPGVVDDDDARVIERREDRRFATEARDTVRVGRDLGVDHLDRDVTSEARIAGAVTVPIPPRPMRACT